MSSPMKLETYLRTKRMTQKALADAIGCSQGLVSQWVCGVTEITPERARDIERATNGELTREQLRPDIFGRPPKSNLPAEVNA